MSRLYQVAAVCSLAFQLVQDPVLAATLHLRAGIIKGDGHVTPVARTVFTLVPSSDISTKEEYLRIGQSMGLSEPNPDDFYEASYEQDNLIVTRTPQIEKFKDTTYEFYRKIVARSNPADYRKYVKIRTNLAGEATIEELGTGQWEIYGSYKDNFASLSWSRRFLVRDGQNEVELANDNSEYNFWPIQVPLMKPVFTEPTEAGRRYASVAKEEIRAASSAILAEEARKTFLSTTSVISFGLIGIGGFLVPMQRKYIGGDTRYPYDVATPFGLTLIWGGLGLAVISTSMPFLWDIFRPISDQVRKDNSGHPIFLPKSGRFTSSLKSSVQHLLSLDHVDLIREIKTSYPILDEFIKARQ